MIKKFNEFLYENFKDDIIFTDITHEKSFNFLKMKNLSEEEQHEITKEFYSKKNKRCYIHYSGRYEPEFYVYDADELDKLLDTTNSRMIDTIGGAIFDTRQLHKKGYFTGYTFNNSIDVKVNRKREGIATAITVFAEKILKGKYRPCNVLSDEMQCFVKNYLQ